jgi:hypothetical protein
MYCITFFGHMSFNQDYLTAHQLIQDIYDIYGFNQLYINYLNI